ncbi:MAG: NAD(P)-dependent alcohol dehydrogenase [candidate division Zixibacteria bacterium]|nr:NAD(P)-dependent alcohol dehydrogenase [candidate division Zixibacteria bacterium]NIR65721.1 NAD(P)-dependent alcohol dehydrogenase [candidate division Zixibacteria bacterium]NIS16100.1 NAD(P)-dependent alcohol dehydrogenase [candidate division Zixibacteria bacterium]NIS47406.1 NAD(P)-dependent alcohol dehydrogenase [candidate division Zixibacteria bacterium]NIT52502.1 NAD(P)-dependent alcohol dehydrogenase [candidate division Zixibacteria bacterium]
MRAFVMKSIGEVGFMEKPVPDEPGANGAVIKTIRALVCTSDTHTVSGAIGEREDLTLGHEAVGFVDKLGREVEHVREGDRVAVNAITPCYKCENCLRGYTSQCTEMLGGWKFANLKDGVFAEYSHVNDAQANLAPIREAVSDDAAVYTTDMMSTGFVGAEHANIPIGGSVAIFAQGPVGLMATVGAKLRGAGLIIAVETVPNRKELAKNYGADIVVDFKDQDAVKTILEITEGRGVDSAIESLGAQKTFEDCVKVTRPGGTISNIGYHGKGDYVEIPRQEWGVGMSDKTIRTALCPGGKERMERLLRLIEMDKVDPTAMTTHTFKFEDLEKAFHIMETKEEDVIKPLIEFD